MSLCILDPLLGEARLSTDCLVTYSSLEESGIVTRCELTTYEPDGLLDLKFSDEERVQKLIMKVRFSIEGTMRDQAESIQRLTTSSCIV